VKWKGAEVILSQRATACFFSGHRP